MPFTIVDATGPIISVKISGEIDKTAGAQVDDQRQLMLVRDSRDFRLRHMSHESTDLVVAQVHFHERGGLGTDRTLVVSGVRAIRRADFD